MLHAPALRDRLPLLRRHAFLLTGSRMAADCAVAMAIARLPRDDTRRPVADGLCHLYQMLHEAVNQVVCQPEGRLPPLHDRILALAPAQRAVLLLVTVEKMPLALVGDICGMSRDVAQGTLAAARAHLDARFMPPNVAGMM